MPIDSRLFRRQSRSITPKIQSRVAVAVLIGGFLASVLPLVTPAQTPTPVAVPTWRYDLTHGGENTNETALTPANVTPSTFGKLFAMPVDTTVYAQPLYVPGLTMSDGQRHNVVFVATENDTVYAFDADSNSGANANPLWTESMLSATHGATSGATAVPYQDTGSPDVAPTVGITGTPAIELATNTMFLVANTKESGVYFSRLHAINIITGAERAGSPVNITATVPGTGAGSSGGQIRFSPLWQNQRTALNYYNGHVYFGYAAHGDMNAWHGWLFAYNASTLQQTAAVCLTPGDHGGGIWGAGAGMPIDTSVSGGRMFVVTGNGARSAAPPFTASTNYGESVIAFNLANGLLTPTDEFTSFNYLTLNTHDWDQGSGGVLMLPDQPGTYPHLLVTAGKEGRVTLLNRDKLGGYASGASSNTNAVQDIPNVTQQAQGFWSTAAYWHGNIYMWAAGDSTGNVPMLFKINSGVLDTTPEKGTIVSQFPSPTFSVSSNGATGGIAWAVRADQFNTRGPAVLYAFNANDVSTPIYESDTKPRDTAGTANKFSVPVVTNGKVYFAARGEVDVYGLLNNEPEVANPDIAPNGGTFASAQTVTLTDSTTSATMYYTLDGTTPTPASTQYTGPITVSRDTTLKAIGTAPGYVQSGVARATFAFSNQTPAVTFSPAAGTYASAQSVTLADTDATAKIYYTTNGTAPTGSSTLYSAAIKVSASETIKAIAIDSAKTNSNVSSAAYVINSGLAINFSGGFSSTTGLQLNGATVASGGALELTTNATAQAGSAFWKTPVNVHTFTTSFHFQILNPQANGMTFTIQNVAPTALGGDSAGLGYQNIGKSVAVKFNFYNYNSEGDDSTGVYTDGQAPVTPTVDMTSSGVSLRSGDTMYATLSYNGTTLALTLLDTVTNARFTMSKAINIPSTVGADTAYVGFTGGTGGLASTMKIISWSYSTSTSNASFALSGNSFTIGWRGGVIHVPITVTPTGGFRGTVTLACSVTPPAGATSIPHCTISAQPPAITGTSAVTGTAYVTTVSTTTLGNYTLNVKGTSGSTSKSIGIPFAVQ
jgi:hypothetical protein